MCRQKNNDTKVYSVIGEGGKKVASIDANTVLVRFEPPDVETPMSPHKSQFFDLSKGMEYVLKPDWHKALFAVTEDKLGALEKLRRSQKGYFDEGVVLRISTLGELMQEFPGANLLEDFRLKMTGDGFETGALILVTSDRNQNPESI